MAFFLTIGHSRLVSVSGSLHLPWQLIIRRFELSDKSYSKTNFEPATRGSVRRASGLVLARHTGKRSAVTKLIAPVVAAGASLACQPMNNPEVQAAWKYHDGQKHSDW